MIAPRLKLKYLRYNINSVNVQGNINCSLGEPSGTQWVSCVVKRLSFCKASGILRKPDEIRVLQSPLLSTMS
jgi:hypothetical protein